MTDKIEITATARNDMGKGASRRLRRKANMIPAIIYGIDKNPMSLAISHDHILHALENKSIFSSILTINIDNKKEQAVLKDLQRHPFKPKILHADFLRIRSDKPIQILVPFNFLNEESSPGIKIDGGFATHHLTEIEITCLPADLPESIDVDVSSLKLNDSIRLSQIKLPEKVELTTNLEESDNDLQVVSISPVKTAEEPETAPEKTPETEITSEKKEKEEEEEEEGKSEKSDKK